MSFTTSSSLRRASSYDAYTSLLAEIHGRIKLGMGATYATSRAKQQQKQAKHRQRPSSSPQPPNNHNDVHDSDSHSSSESEDDLDWEYNDSPTAPEEDVLTFRHDLYYEFMNEPETLLAPSSSTASPLQHDTTLTSLSPQTTVDLNQAFHDQLKASAMMVDLHSYYMDYQQRRLRDGLAFQDILEFIREHTRYEDSLDMTQQDKEVQELILKLKDNLAQDPNLSVIQSQAAQEAAISLMGETVKSPSLTRAAASYTSSVLKPNPGFLTLKIPDIALAADGLDNLSITE